MELLTKAKAVFFDFDGVLKESLDIKAEAFQELFSPYGKDVSVKIRQHHEANNGKSRYEKLPLYLGWISQEPSKEKVAEFADAYSLIVKDQVIGSPWISGAQDALIKLSTSKLLFLVTATPYDEIKEILENLNAYQYFAQVNGSPISKSEAIRKCLRDFQIRSGDAVFIGDTRYDYDAAQSNSVAFILRKTNQNLDLQRCSNLHIINDLEFVRELELDV